MEAARMRRKKVKPNYRKTILRLPDLDHSKSSVLNSLSSPGSRRAYGFAIDQFIAWYCSEPRDVVGDSINRNRSRAQSSGGTSIPASFGKPRLGGRDHQSETCGSKTTCLRGRRFRITEP